MKKKLHKEMKKLPLDLINIKKYRKSKLNNLWKNVIKITLNLIKKYKNF